MIGKIFAAAATIAVAIFADRKVKVETGLHIHEHLFEWWCKMRDRITQWLHSHPELKIQRTCLEWVDNIDAVVVHAKRTLKASAVDTGGTKHSIYTVEVPIEEAFKQFPELRHQREVLLHL